VHVGLSNAVVGGSAVGGRIDEGNVEVSVIILFEVSGDDMALTLETLSIKGKLAHKDINHFVITSRQLLRLLFLLLGLIAFFLFVLV